MKISQLIGVFMGVLGTLFSFIELRAQVDPIRLSMVSSHSTVNTGQDEFEITITASYLTFPTGSVFFLEEAGSFSLKLNFPANFRQTGGTYRDYIGTTLSNQNPQVTYTVTGKLQDASDDAVFQLLRGAKGASSNSLFVEVATLRFKVNNEYESASLSGKQLTIAATPGYIAYMTLEDFYNDMFTENVIYITDLGLNGLFHKDESSTLPDNGATVLVKNNVRYIRVSDGILNVSWFGIVPDGNTDHTAAIQNLLNGTHSKHLYFPKGNGSYKISDLRIYSNTQITFENSVYISGLQTKINGTMFLIYDSDNVTITGKNVIVDDLNPNYQSYPTEWRNIFGIHGGKDITIEGIKAINGGGDGFYIGSGGIRPFCENIKLTDIVASGNRRQGLSIITGKKVYVLRAVFENTSGILPGAGVDIEPNSSNHFLEHIVLKDIITINNKGAGIIVGPSALAGSGKYINILIENHFDQGSAHGAVVTTVKTQLNGTVKFVNPVWKNNKGSAFMSRNWSSRGPMVELIRPTILNPNENGSTSNVLGASILVYRPAGDIGDTNIGNLHIYNAGIQDTRSPRKIISTVCFRDIASNQEVKYCSVSDFLKVESTAIPYLITHNASVAVTDSHLNFELDLADFTRYVNNIYWASLYHNESSTATRYIRLEKVSVGFPEFTVEVRNNKGIRLLPLANENIVPLSPANGKYVYSTTVGSRIRLKRFSDNSWIVVEMTGTWGVEP